MHLRYTVSQEQRGGETLQVLRDSQSGAEAKVWAELGANCVQLVLPHPAGNGQLVTIIDDQDNLHLLAQQPSRYGNPILYPWASRISRGKYYFRGKPYQAVDLHTDGDAWHGLVRMRPWEVLANSADDSHASLTCTISTHSRPDILDSYPFPNSLTVTFRLDHDGLTVSAQVRNIGTGDMPFGFGFHPYFKVPISEAGERSKCLVEVHARRLWDWAALTSVDPARENPGPAGPLTMPNAFPAQSPLGTRDFNEGFTDLEDPDGTVRARVIDTDAGLAVVMDAQPDVKSLVVYTPPNRNAICLEPWTCTANTFHLAEVGIADSGLLVLAPGGVWNSEMRIGLGAI